MSKKDWHLDKRWWKGDYILAKRSGLEELEKVVFLTVSRDNAGLDTFSSLIAHFYKWVRNKAKFWVDRALQKNLLEVVDFCPKCKYSYENGFIPIVCKGCKKEILKQAELHRFYEFIPRFLLIPTQKGKRFYERKKRSFS